MRVFVPPMEHVVTVRLQEEAEMSKYVAKHLSQQSVWGGTPLGR